MYRGVGVANTHRTRSLADSQRAARVPLRVYIAYVACFLLANGYTGTGLPLIDSFSEVFKVCLFKLCRLVMCSVVRSMLIIKHEIKGIAELSFI